MAGKCPFGQSHVGRSVIESVAAAREYAILLIAPVGAGVLAFVVP